MNLSHKFLTETQTPKIPPKNHSTCYVHENPSKLPKPPSQFHLQKIHPVTPLGQPLPNPLPPAKIPNNVVVSPFYHATEILATNSPSNHMLKTHPCQSCSHDHPHQKINQKKSTKKYPDLCQISNRTQITNQGAPTTMRGNDYTKESKNRWITIGGTSIRRETTPGATTTKMFEALGTLQSRCRGRAEGKGGPFKISINTESCHA